MQSHSFLRIFYLLSYSSALRRVLYSTLLDGSARVHRVTLAIDTRNDYVRDQFWKVPAFRRSLVFAESEQAISFPFLSRWFPWNGAAWCGVVWSRPPSGSVSPSCMTPKQTQSKRSRPATRPDRRRTECTLVCVSVSP